MFIKTKYSVREAAKTDTRSLANLIHFELYVHRHLDWRPPLDWLGYQPYLVLEQDGRIGAALACPPDPAETAWIRLFAVIAEISPEKAWEALWPEALEKLRGLHGVQQAAAIPLQHWFEVLLVSHGFYLSHRVVMLSWEAGISPPGKNGAEKIIRPMNYDDLDIVEQVDRAAFGQVWQNSKESLLLAFQQAAVATVVEQDNKLVGYQISTATPMGGHLARLAVLPEYQGAGLGFALVRDMLLQFERRGAATVTVNTQQDNHASLALYQKAGFRRTGEQYPVYLFPIQGGNGTLRMVT